MTVALTDKQQAWLERQVKAGKLPSVEDGVRLAVANLMTIAEDDLSWAQEYIEAARADVKAGDVVDGSHVTANLRNRAAF